MRKKEKSHERLFTKQLVCTTMGDCRVRKRSTHLGRCNYSITKNSPFREKVSRAHPSRHDLLNLCTCPKLVKVFI